MMRSVALLLSASPALGWKDCSFPHVDFMALDEGIGISYAYAVAAMNGKLYSGGYTKGNFGLVGVNQTHDSQPLPAATLWADAVSDVQNLYIAEVSEDGVMEQSWFFKGSAIQVGAIGHGPQTNEIRAHSGLHKMLDKQHLAVAGGFKQRLKLPDGTEWSSACYEGETTCSGRAPSGNVPFVMKLDVSKTAGIGPGTTGWAKQMDTEYRGGASVISVDGDADGNMIAVFDGCTAWDPSASRGAGGGTGCNRFVTKLDAAGGAEVWKIELPDGAKGLSSCRTISDGSFYCGFTLEQTSGEVDFGNGVVVSSASVHVGVVKFNSDGVAQWASATLELGVAAPGERTPGSFGDLAVSSSGGLLVVTGSPPTRGSTDKVGRISTASGSEGEVLWEDTSGKGSHGFRGVEVTDDHKEVHAFGQHYSSQDLILTDPSGATHTIRSRSIGEVTANTYDLEVYIVAFDAEDGTGMYAIDGGGSGMEYFFAMASDPDTHEIYVGGMTRSEYIQFGDVKRENPLYEARAAGGEFSSSTPVGSSKAFVVKTKSTPELPACLDSCTPQAAVPWQVKEGHCYINRHCIAHEEHSTYNSQEVALCSTCDATANQHEWTDPMHDSCLIDNVCYVAGTYKKTVTVSYRGPSTTISECEWCDPTKSTSEYSILDTFEFRQNKCVLKTFDEAAQALARKENWRRLPERCWADDEPTSRRQRRQMREVKKRQRKLSYSGVPQKATYASPTKNAYKDEA
jgi:hypothetical protein